MFALTILTLTTHLNASGSLYSHSNNNFLYKSIFDRFKALINLL